jgi:glutaminyl-peptide cyclotransferase
LADARILSFIVIDFEYGPSYNTTQDPVDKYSAQSFETVDARCYKFLYLP